MVELADRINETVKKYEPELRKLALDIHDNPELGMKEFKACKWQTDLLEKYGFQVERNLCGFQTAYRASYKSGKTGPKIAMMAEYDALPGLGHGCGHNLIAMMSLGSGLVLKEFAEELGGEIYVIGTPAEETAGTKVEMSRQGVFDEMDVAMMAHPFFRNTDSANYMAIIGRRYEFFGKPSHAASAPDAGINALDAVINFFNLINAMRQQCQDDARIHGVISDGGLAPNVIPDYTAANFYIRANLMSDVVKLENRIENCAKAAAMGTGCTYKISPFEEDFMDCRSNQTLNRLAVSNIEKFSPYPFSIFGKNYIPGSTDVGDVSYSCPAIMLGAKIGDSDNPMEQHTPHVVECAASETALENAVNFIKGFAMAGIELITKPEILKEIKAEFAEIKNL